jgi:glycine cleavage system aminomethyltransferase T
VSCSIAFAYLPAAASKAGDAVELDLFGRLVPGTIVDDPLYDPGNTRIRSA